MSKDDVGVFIFPIFSPKRNQSGNSYLRDFTNTVASSGFKVKSRGSNYGLFSIFFNIKSDVFIFHWVESINKVYQGFGFVCGVILLWILKKRIIWVLHNKKKHNGSGLFGALYMKIMCLLSDDIITHSNAGVAFINEHYGAKFSNKTRYIPHPVYSSKLYYVNSETQWDIVVWGSIQPYKNIKEFMRFVNSSKILSGKRILIIGRCDNDSYVEQLNRYVTNNIVFRNEFLSEEHLKDVLAATKAILFTYNLDSVLSSGALIYSLNFNKLLIGPNGGAFRDLSKMVVLYDTFDDIEKVDLNQEPNREEIETYITINTWGNAVKEILD